ncbi:MAG: carboxymuconolactone decarboxylase family protein, partial [Nitrospinota bacterium]
PDSACPKVRAICSSVKRFLFMANLSFGRSDFARKVAFRLGQDPGSTPTRQGQLRQVEWKGLVSILAGALVQACGILFFWSAVKSGDLTQVIPLSRLSLLLIIFFSWLFFRKQESVTWRVVAGGILALRGRLSSRAECRGRIKPKGRRIRFAIRFAGECGPLPRSCCLCLEEAKMEPEAKKLIERIKASRGWILPEQEFMAERDYEFYRRHNEKFDHFMNRDNALPRKVLELLYIVALCVRLPAGETQTYIKNHIRQALEHGATEQEILEAIELVIFPGGSPSMNAGIKAFMEVLEERDAAG